MLQSCEATSKLVISDLGLRPVQIQSVFRALQCQNTLKELYLPGNCIKQRPIRLYSNYGVQSVT